MEKFLFKHNKDFDLHLKSCAAIGLGDNKYDNEYNMESANILDNYITTHNGNICIEPLKINKSPLPHLYNNVETWVQHFIKII
jgi:flavodoxin